MIKKKQKAEHIKAVAAPVAAVMNAENAGGEWGQEEEERRRSSRPEVDYDLLAKTATEVSKRGRKIM